MILAERLTAARKLAAALVRRLPKYRAFQAPGYSTVLAPEDTFAD